MSEDNETYITVEDEFGVTCLAQGMVVDQVELGDRTLYSFDNKYYFHKCSKKYHLVFKTYDTIGEPMPFRGHPDSILKDLGSAQYADIYVNMSERVLQELYTNLCEVIGKFHGVGARWAKYNSNLFVERVNAFSDGLDRFLKVMEHAPSGIPDIIKCVPVLGSHDSQIGRVRIDFTSEVDYIERFERLTHLCKYLQTYVSCGNLYVKEKDLTYLNNIGRRSFQWELWAMCNQLCKFCYLGETNRATDKARQLKSLRDCNRAVEELDFYIYNNISLIGGEFFQGQLNDPEVHDEFMKLMRKCAEHYAEGRIGSVWLTCTLTLGDQKHLYEVLDIFQEYGCEPNEYGSSGLWLCTSWDAEGRFYTPDRKENWDFHMKNIQQKYPWVKFNTTIILMQKMLEMYINNEWSPKQFMEEYKTTLFFKQIGLGETPDELKMTEEYAEADWPTRYRMGKKYLNEHIGFEFVPRRKTMLEFLRKFATEDPELYDRLYNIVFRADELHRNYNDKNIDVKTTRNKHSNTETDVEQEGHLNTCGHILNYAPYSDSDKCCICDKQMIWDSIHGGM